MSWSPGKVTVDNGAILFNDATYIICDAENPSVVEAEFQLKNLDFGLILRYNSNDEFLLFTTNGVLRYNSNDKFLLFTTNGVTAFLYRANVLNSAYYTYLIDSKDVYTGNTIVLSAYMNDTHYELYVDNQRVFDTTIPDFSSGYAGLYSQANNLCTAFSAYADQPLFWT